MGVLTFEDFERDGFDRMVPIDLTEKEDETMLVNNQEDTPRNVAEFHQQLHQALRNSLQEAEKSLRKREIASADSPRDRKKPCISRTPAAPSDGAGRKARIPPSSFAVSHDSIARNARGRASRIFLKTFGRPAITTGARSLEQKTSRFRALFERMQKRKLAMLKSDGATTTEQLNRVRWQSGTGSTDVKSHGASFENFQSSTSSGPDATSVLLGKEPVPATSNHSSNVEIEDTGRNVDCVSGDNASDTLEGSATTLLKGHPFNDKDVLGSSDNRDSTRDVSIREVGRSGDNEASGSYLDCHGDTQNDDMAIQPSVTDHKIADPSNATAPVANLEDVLVHHVSAPPPRGLGFHRLIKTLLLLTAISIGGLHFRDRLQTESKRQETSAVISILSLGNELD